MSLEMDNDSQELEKYGVWVKKSAPAPEPVSEEPSAADLVADLPDFNFMDDPAVEPELTDMPDFSDIVSEDFSIEEPVFDEEPVIEDSVENEPSEESFTIEESVSEEDPVIEDSIENDTVETELSMETDSTDDFDISSMEMPDISDFEITENINLDNLTESEEPAADEPSAESIEAVPTDIPVASEDPSSYEISFDVEEPSADAISFETEEISLDAFEDVSLDDFSITDESEPAPETSAEAEQTIEVPAEEITITADSADQDIFGDVSFEDVSASTIENFGEIEFEDATHEIPLSELVNDEETESEPVLNDVVLPESDEDTTEISFETESGEPERAVIGNETEEIDIDSFLDFGDDMGTVTSSEDVSFEDTGLRDFTSSEAISLDDFMATPQAEKNDVQNEEPLSIDLSFDDSFTAETQAAPENDIETEASFEEPSDASFDVDDIFDSVQDVSFPDIENAGTEETPVVVSGEEITFDEVSEFDDLLGSLNDDSNEPSDHENTAITSTPSFTPSTPTVRDYDMSVSLDDSEDDDFDELSSTVSSKVAEEAPSEEPAPAAQEPVAETVSEETPSEESELTEEDVMTDDMKAVLAQLDEDFGGDDTVAITQDALDALTHTDDTTTGEPEEEGPEMADNMNTALLEKILNELSSLKSEVASIRSDVDALKAAPPAVSEVTPAVESEVTEEESVSFDETEPEEEPEENFDHFDAAVAEENAIEESPSEDDVVEEEVPVPETSGGFFGADDEDDTIALSGDELDNILNCANFTEEEAPTITIEETTAENFYEDSEPAPEADDFADSFNSLNTTIEEPVIDEFAMDMPEESSENELPDEIEIPQMGDDFIVESSSSDFLDGMEEEKSIADSITDANDDFLSADENIDSMTEEFEITEEALEATEDAPIEDIEDVVVEDTDTELSSFPTEEDILMSEEDETFQVFDEDAPAEEEAVQSEIPLSEYIDEEVDTTPTDKVFGPEQWSEEERTEEEAEEETVTDEISIDEPVFESEPEITEEPVIEEDGAETETDTVEDEPFVAEEPTADEESIAEDESITEEPVIDESAEDTETVFEETPAEETPAEETVAADAVSDEPSEETTDGDGTIPEDLKEDVKSVLVYMDQLLENLPEDKIAEFARSEHFDVYKKLFTELGLA